MNTGILHSFMLTGLVCLALAVLGVAAFGLAWIYDRTPHWRYLWRTVTMEQSLRRLLWLNAAQIAACALVGLAAGAAMYLGYCADVLR